MSLSFLGVRYHLAVKFNGLKMFTECKVGHCIFSICTIPMGCKLLYFLVTGWFFKCGCMYQQYLLSLTPFWCPPLKTSLTDLFLQSSWLYINIYSFALVRVGSNSYLIGMRIGRHLPCKKHDDAHCFVDASNSQNFFTGGAVPFSSQSIQTKTQPQFVIYHWEYLHGHLSNKCLHF